MEARVTLSPQHIRLAARGDRFARERLVEAHGPVVYALCRRLCADPDDAYQDVWAKVFRALPRFDPSRSETLRSWVSTIARRHLIDLHRRARVRGTSTSADTLVDPSPSPAQLADRTELRDHLEAALTQLPHAQRVAVVGHDIHGTPLAELAGDQGVALGTIKSRLHRGRARLAALVRASLAGDPDDPR